MFLPELKSKPEEDISILLKLDNHSSSYLCECGDASDLMVKDCQDIDALFISHTHIDHFINFDQLLRHQIGLQKRVIVCGPEGIMDRVQSKIQGYSWNLIEAGAIIYEIREIIQKNHINRYVLEPPNWELKALGRMNEEYLFDNDRFHVQFAILDHKIPSIAYLFKEKDTIKIDLSQSSYRGGPWINSLKQAFKNNKADAAITIESQIFQAKQLFHLLHIKKGDSLGVIMDHAANPSNHEKIKHLFYNCNKVFIESFYKEADKELATLNFHSFSKESGRIMHESAVKEAIPVHFSRKYKADERQELIEEFKAAFSAVKRTET